MSIKLLKAMVSRPASKGWFHQFGKKKYHRRERHIKSQMKFFSKASPVRRDRYMSWR